MDLDTNYDHAGRWLDPVDFIAMFPIIHDKIFNSDDSLFFERMERHLTVTPANTKRSYTIKNHLGKVCGKYPAYWFTSTFAIPEDRDKSLAMDHYITMGQWSYNLPFKKYNDSIMENIMWGKLIMLFPDGREQLEMTMMGNQPNGDAVHWSDEGTYHKKEAGTYRHGEKDGFWTEWYANGNIKFEGTYKNGKKDGLAIYYFRDSKRQRQVERTYTMGRVLNGPEIFYFDNNQRRQEKWRVEGKEVGTSLKWNKEGDVTEEATWGGDGELVHLCKKISMSPGVLAREDNFNGNSEKDGIQVIWTKNLNTGEVRKDSEEQWENGLQHGKSIRWFGEKKREESEYSGGVLISKTEYNSGDIKILEVQYAGTSNERWQQSRSEWRDDGTLIMVTEYSTKTEYKRKHYDEKGNYIITEYFKDGQKVGEKKGG